MNILFYAVVSLSVLLSACSGSSGAGSDNAIDDAAWRVISNDGKILGGIDVSAGATGTLTVINNEDSLIGAPSLSMYDLTTGSATSLSISGSSDVAAGDSISGTFAFPGGTAPADDALILLYVGGEQTAVFVTKEVYENLSPAIVNEGANTSLSKAPFSYIMPHSGSWDFEMDMSASYLTGINCPASSPSYTSSGTTSLYVSTSGYSASWNVDSNSISFNRLATSSTFESPTYSFEVDDGDTITFGTNSWELTPSSTSHISGTLNWNNNLGCTAAYPITMTYEVPATPTIFLLCEGVWNINYSPLVCNSNPITPGALPNLPYPTGTLDVTYGPSGEPLLLSIGSLAGYQMLPNISGTNIYGSGIPNLLLGTTTDVFGTPLTLVGGYQLTALSNSMMFGVVTVTGHGLHPCTGVGVITMTAVTGC